MGHYELGKEYFIKARVADIGHDGQYPLRVMVPVVSSPLKCEYTSIYIANEPGILLTASEAAAELVEDTNAQIALYKDEVKKLRSENDSLKDTVEVLKEQKKGLEKTIDKHETTIEERTIECNRWEGMYDKASKRCDELQKTCEEDTTVAIDLANQRDNLKRKYEAALKDLAKKDEDCEMLKRQLDEALKANDDLQKALETLNKGIDGYRATIKKMAAVIGFLCGAGEVNNG